MNRRFCVLCLFFCLGIPFLEQILAEINEGLGCFGDVAVFFPGKADIDNKRVGQRNGLDTRRIFDYHVKQKGNADTTGNQSFQQPILSR